MNYLSAFIIGIIECFGISLNIKFLQKNKKIPAFIISFINILLWFVIIDLAVQSLHDWTIRIIYAVGFAFGEVLAIQADEKIERWFKKI